MREAALRDAREELPHSIMVTIDEMSEREEKGSRPFFDIHATIHVERDSQTGILLGHKGERLKDIGMRARKDIERELGARIFLGLHVKVAKELTSHDPSITSGRPTLIPTVSGSLRMSTPNTTAIAVFQ